MVSTAPMRLSVSLPYTAPKVRVGEMTEIKTKRVTAIVFWLKLVISATQCVPTVLLKSPIIPVPQLWASSMWTFPASVMISLLFEEMEWVESPMSSFKLFAIIVWMKPRGCREWSLALFNVEKLWKKKWQGEVICPLKGMGRDPWILFPRFCPCLLALSRDFK